MDKSNFDFEINDEVKDFLNKVGQEKQEEADEIVYGIYDNSQRSIFSRINDFFIDRSKISLKEKSYFFHLMSVMLDAGLSLIQTLKILSRRTRNEHFRRILATLAHNVEQGKALSDSLEQFPAVFDEAETGIIRSGEAIGHLDKMLIKLSGQLERTYELTLRVKTALIYPITVLAALFAAGGVLTFFVVPQLAKFFEQSGIKVPAATRVFMSVSTFIFDFWWLFVMVGLIVFVFLNFYKNTINGRLKYDYYKLKIPFIGEVIRKLIMARFISMLEVLTSSGLPIIKTLSIIAEAIGNEVYRRKIHLVRLEVEQGKKLSPSLAGVPFLFPETLVQMLNIGEQSSSLDRAAEKLGIHYLQEAEHSIKALTTALEPIVIVMIGLMVALVAFAILGPIFSLTDVATAA